jgi:hypothetical protein
MAMRLRPQSPFLILVSLAAVLGTTPAAHAAEPQWLEIQSPHFSVVTDAGEKRGREVAMRFEQMRAVFGEFLSRKKLKMPVPLTIYAVRDDKRFFQMAPLHNGQPITTSFGR